MWELPQQDSPNCTWHCTSIYKCTSSNLKALSGPSNNHSSHVQLKPFPGRWNAAISSYHWTAEVTSRCSINLCLHFKPPMCNSGIICYVSRHWRFPSVRGWGENNEDCSNTAHAWNEGSHRSNALLLWQRGENNHSTGMLALSMWNWSFEWPLPQQDTELVGYITYKYSDSTLFTLISGTFCTSSCSSYTSFLSLSMGHHTNLDLRALADNSTTFKPHFHTSIDCSLHCKEQKACIFLCCSHTSLQHYQQPVGCP